MSYNHFGTSQGKRTLEGKRASQGKGTPHNVKVLFRVKVIYRVKVLHRVKVVHTSHGKGASQGRGTPQCTGYFIDHKVKVLHIAKVINKIDEYSIDDTKHRRLLGSGVVILTSDFQVDCKELLRHARSIATFRVKLLRAPRSHQTDEKPQ